mmetsp:Transcript_22314/g.46238  ORF Transcript_22314/g.46238 Transcript_22314/m.46238 type:complete len:684 (-) Transcript_22314:1284-3335(-)
MMKGKVDPLMRDRIALKRRESYDRIAAKLNSNGVDVSVAGAATLFDKKRKPHLEKFLEKESVEVKDMATYLYEESCRKVDQARLKGANTIRHCPFTIRLSALLARKLGQSDGLHELLCKTFRLPTLPTVRKYSSPGAHEPDGIQYEALQKRSEEFASKKPDAGSRDWSRFGSLAFDAMYTRDGVVQDYHTLEVVGLTNDYFNEDIVKSQLGALSDQANADAEDENANDDDASPIEDSADTNQAAVIATSTTNSSNNEPTKVAVSASKTKSDFGADNYPSVGKQFLAFYFTTLDSTFKMQFMAARYSVASLDGDFMGSKIDEVIVALAMHGFIVVMTGGDGAAENRFALKARAYISAKDFFATYKETLADFIDYDIVGIMPDLPLAFHHPVHTDILIFVGGDMPHAIKKFVNALEVSGWPSHSRNLRFRGQKLSLQMIERCWVKSGDASIDKVTLRKYKKSHDHFNRDSYSRLCVWLAVNIPSQDSIKCIKDNCDKDLGGMKVYGPLVEVLESLDRLIDIVNCTRMNGVKYKGCEPIDHPLHPHIFELLSTVKLLTEWKDDCGGFTDEFLADSTYEDFCWTILSIVGVAFCYLDGLDRSMYQGRTGSDICEHLFSLLRSGNPNPNLGACRNAASKSNSGMDSFLFRTRSKSNSSGAKRKPEDFLRPMPKKSRLSGKDSFWDLES